MEIHPWDQKEPSWKKYKKSTLELKNVCSNKGTNYKILSNEILQYFIQPYITEKDFLTVDFRCIWTLHVLQINCVLNLQIF